MSDGIDLVKYGVLWNRVENYEQRLEAIDKKIDKMESQLDQLVANSNKQQGMAWLGVGMLSVLSTIGGWVIHYFTSKWVMSEFAEGVKALTSSLDSARESSKSLTKSVEDIKKDGRDVATQMAQDRIRAKREAEAKKRLAIHKALAEYKQRKLISQEEYSLKVNFLRQFPNKAVGEKEWAEILKIKKELEELEKKEKAQFDGDLKNIRRAQFLCFLVAGWIAYVIVWGGKWTNKDLYGYCLVYVFGLLWEL